MFSRLLSVALTGMMMVSSIEATGTDPSTDPNTTTGIAYSHNRFCPVVKGAILQEKNFAMDHKQYLHCNYGSPDPGLPQAELSCAYDASGSLANQQNIYWKKAPKCGQESLQGSFQQGCMGSCPDFARDGSKLQVSSMYADIDFEKKNYSLMCSYLFKNKKNKVVPTYCFFDLNTGVLNTATSDKICPLHNFDGAGRCLYQLDGDIDVNA